jgi:hypothetical protein
MSLQTGLLLLVCSLQVATVAVYFSRDEDVRGPISTDHTAVTNLSAEVEFLQKQVHEIKSHLQTLPRMEVLHACYAESNELKAQLRSALTKEPADSAVPELIPYWQDSELPTAALSAERATRSRASHLFDGYEGSRDDVVKKLLENLDTLIDDAALEGKP